MIDTNNEDDVRTLLNNRLLEAGFPKEQAEAFAESAIEAWAEESLPPPPAPGTMRAAIKSRRWVIRNDDLGLLELAGGLAVAAVTVATGGMAAVPAAAAMVLAQSLILDRRLRKKGVFLSRDSFAVLSTLREANGPMTATEVARKLGHEGMRGAIQDLSPERMKKLLEGLAGAIQADGKQVALVTRQDRKPEGKEDLWRAVDV